MTMVSNLPLNLIEEILSRVSLKSMGEVRLTCKEWDTLSKSRSVSKMHIDKLRAVKEGESLIITMLDDNLYLMSVVIGVNEDPLVECKGKLTCAHKKLSQVFHCDGLLLCFLKDDETKVMVWNPYWGQTRLIELSSYRRRPFQWEDVGYGLGYEDKGSCRSYKFLRFIDNFYDAPVNQFLWYEIYDLDSSSWKTHHDVTPHWLIQCGQRGVSLKGNTYWPASQRNTNYGTDDHIICFDFTSESFGPLLRLPFDAGADDYVKLSCVGDEKLAVSLAHNAAGPLNFEIWITTKIEAEEVTWSKFLKVETGTGFYALVCCKSIFIDEEKKVAIGFDGYYSKYFNIVGEDGYFEKIELGESTGRNENYSRTNACSYVPSLVQIKQPAACMEVKGNNKTT